MNRENDNDTPAQTRQKLLRATEILLVREGVHALTVRRIAGEADVNSALVRYHFGGTDGLLDELALRNAACMADARDALLEGLSETGPPHDFDEIVDALVLPLWAEAAMAPEHRAIIVLDEIFARSVPELHEKIWALFAEGVNRVTTELGRCLPDTDPTILAWRIRFVTAAALDVPPRATRSRSNDARSVYRKDDREERLHQFQLFARHALRP
ncbi:MAG: TetR/AcrR family transcriptional regulator [Sphingobium sp.]|nr:TetR/AcrR family transcriptional regulator [Sphingobium sp.]